MKISLQKLSWMITSFALALLAGAPAVADDTELLLIQPDPSKRPIPNVMFILDTSGSMTTTQSTTEPYDYTQTYAGDCDPTRIYWTDVDLEPDCATTSNYVEGSAYVCNFATMQLQGIGSYTDTHVQYRAGGKDGTSTSTVESWNYISPLHPDNPVECQADSGTHGDGEDTSKLYAASGNNLSFPWTEDPKGVVSWGSSPRNYSYTVYTGNYINWKNSPETVILSRSDIMKEVAKKVLSSVNNLNVGLMRFNSTEGGTVILGLTDLDDNRQAVLDTIDDLPADGWTPLSETLYESALYWRGMAEHFGGTDVATDPQALASTDPDIYTTPPWDVCAKNFNVLLTDGAPTEDIGTPGLVDNLPGFSAAVGTGCDGATGNGQCLDDVAEYLSKYDLDPVTDGDQFVTTHTIGFTVDLDILQETADDSGGEYFLADNVQSLTRALLQIIANINDRSLSFSAPAVSVNTFNRTQNLNDLYITTFGARARAHWPGNLKKYRIYDGDIVDRFNVPAVDPATGFFKDTASSIWTTGPADGNNVRRGGAARQLPDYSVRKVYTNNSGNDLTAGINAVSTANIGAFVPLDFGLTGAAGEPTLAEIIRWTRGEDLRDEDGNIATDMRYTMGDPLHSQPAAVVYGGTAQNPEVVVYTATNDGYLHAIDGETGVELWSFIPKQLLQNLRRLYFDPASKYKQYGLDGNVVSVMKDVDRDGIIESADGDFVQIVFGMRRGGTTYFSLDVTDKNAPELLWTLNEPAMGESWSSPVVARMDINSVTQNADKAVIVVGGGYDTVHDTSQHPSTPDAFGASVHFFDLRTGAELWRASSDATADLQLSSMTRSFPNEMRVIDLTGDGLADRIYGTDMGGQIWRFDIFNGQAPADLVTGGVIAQLGAEGISNPSEAETRRFYNAPDVALITDKNQQRRYIAINVGSGYRAHPFDLTAEERFFSLRDGDVFNQLSQQDYDNYPVATDADLVEVSGKTQTVITASDRGWKLTLPSNEKVLATSLTFDDEVFFVSFTPDSLAASSCSAGQGTNFLYRVSAINGDPVVPNIDTLDPDDSDSRRKSTLQQGGIAPEPRFLFPSADDPNCTGADCNPPPIGCIGVECFDPGFENNPVRTLWTQDGIE
jgi:type IV pilus assembly protein PilY1